MVKYLGRFLHVFRDLCFYIREWGLLPFRTKSVLIFETSKLADECRKLPNSILEKYEDVFSRGMLSHTTVAAMTIREMSESQCMTPFEYSKCSIQHGKYKRLQCPSNTYAQIEAPKKTTNL